MELNISEVLQLKNFDETFTIEDISVVGCSNNSQVPLIYSMLYSQNKISLDEYKLLKRLWRICQKQVYNLCNFPIEFPTTTMIDCLSLFFDTDNITKNNRNSFESTLTKMKNMKLISVNKPQWGMITISLSPSIFNKTSAVLSRKYSGVSLYSVLYLETCDDDFIGKYKELCSLLGVNFTMTTNICEEIMRTPIRGIRQPIIGLREPILGLRHPIFITQKVSTTRKKGKKINFDAKKYEGLTDDEKKQLERYAVFGRSFVDRQLRQIRKKAFSCYSEEEEKCINEFIPYYENLICKITDRVEIKLLNHTTHKKASRNWTPLWKCYNLCLDRGWNWKIYLDAQFDSFKNWSNGNAPYPMPNMLYSDRAIRAYENYVYHNETAYQNEGWETKVSAQEVGTYPEEVQKTLRVDLSVIEDYIKYSLKRSFNKTFKKVDKNRSDLESLYYSKSVESQWESLSVECWLVIPQMDEYLSRVYGNYASIDAKIDEYRNLMKNTKKVDIIRECWNNFNVPTLFGVLEIDERLEKAT